MIIMKKQKDLKLMYEDILRSEVWKDEKMVKHCLKEMGYIVGLENGDIIILEKPRIKKDFCFGYSDSSYDTVDYDNANDMAHHARKSEEYFIDKNLDQIRDTIKGLKSKEGARFKWGISTKYTGQKENSKLKEIYQYDQFDGKEHTEVSKDDIDRVIQGYEEVEKAFNKRLKTYLKRYGLTKVNSWSYWKDA